MNSAQDEKLYQAILELGVVEKAKIDRALAQSRDQNKSLEEILVGQDLIADENIGRILSDIAGVPLVRLGQVSIPEEVLKLIPEVTAKKQKMITFARDKEGVKLAMADPKNTEVLEFVAKKLGEKVFPYLATRRDIDLAMGQYRRNLQKTFDQMLAEQVSQAKGGNDAPIERIVDLLIEYAYANRASDIHIEPAKKSATVRFRVDGVLHDVLELPKALDEQVVLRIKVMAKLRTDEKMAAQDGKAQMKLENEELDIRVSIVPVINGEKIVMRLLAAKARQFSLADLGMNERDLEAVKSGFERSFGMVLSTGPTGSGKTTSVYAILKTINIREVNIATIEDPVEYDIDGINQIQVNSATNLTFASGLRAILRQDPNVIFVGEIRDSETADIAVNAAMTGHLVLSTLHTNDAATTLPRLLELGVEPFLVASTVNVVVGQRLVRKICVKCRVSEEIGAEKFSEYLPKEIAKKYVDNKKSLRVYKGKGCSVCYLSGYQGRIGIFEVLKVTEGIRELVVAKADFETIRKRAQKEGMTTMMEDGLEKVLAGTTTLEEILKATRQ